MTKSVLTQSRKNKALRLVQQGRFAEAQSLLIRLCNADRFDAELWFTLGAVNGKLEKIAESVECFRKAITLSPDNALAHYNLGIALRGLNRVPEAIEAFRAVTRLAPARVEPYANLGYLLLTLGQFDEAASHLRTALKLNPRDSDGLAYLGRILQFQGQLEEAAQCYRKALEIAPGYVAVHDNLGSALCDQGQYTEAIAEHRRALQLANGADPVAHSNLLLTLQYVPDADPREVFAEHRRWAEANGRSPVAIQPHANSRNPERQLRIGFVSADFRTHSAAFFFEPLLAARDRVAVEVFCYSAAPRPDATTARLKALADHWRDINGVPDARMAEMIRNDGIDILVDLAGHTGYNRLKVFARQPAPVQVTWLGYPNTTGLKSIGYRITDEFADPQGTEEFYSERLVRLPGCFLCYQPLADAPAVAPLPAARNGYVTFGSFNNLPKVNPSVVALWTRILQAVPDARLFIKSPPLTDAATRERYYDLFVRAGLPRERVELRGRTVSQTEHLALYEKLDIALDPFPYNGTTTTCEALWMGVPVLTLAGVRHAGRVGVSLLTAAGLPDWIARSPEEYVALAARFAADREKLAAQRAGLRERVAGSMLCDRTGFARKFEIACREMWRRWCATG